MIRSLAVVGAKGRMGRLFVDRSRAAGLTVAELDKPLLEADLASALPEADMVLLSVPAPATGEVAAMAAPYMRQGAILCDLCSVKAEPVRAMLAAYDGPVVGTHPLFGPNPGDYVRVAVTPGRGGDEEISKIDKWLQALDFQPFRSTCEEHDRAAAVIQGLNFVTNLAYLAVAADSAVERFVTPSFERRLESAKKMLTEDSELFMTLFDANPYSHEAVRLFRSYLNVAAGGDVEVLVARANWWWWRNWHIEGEATT